MSIRGSYDTVVCIDVVARYSSHAAAALLAHLTSLATSRLILTYTPKGWLDRLWLAIGNHFAKRKHAAPLYTHREADIAAELRLRGWTIHRKAKVTAGWRSYFCCVLECRPSESPEVWY
jgi:magnesium-protoporphyrin O-methyltransferase